MQKVLREGNMRVIVQNIDADSLERILSGWGVRVDSPVKEVIIHATSGRTSERPAYRMQFLVNDVCVSLREPGELCATFEGDSASVQKLLTDLKIPHDTSVLHS